MFSVVISVVRWVGWVAYFSGALLIVTQTLRDFGPGGEELFIEQRGELGRQPAWRFCLYLHVAGGVICLLSSLPQLSRAVLRGFPKVHRWSGRIYAAGVLILVCPSGMYLALHAKGGLAGKTGFLVLGAATFFTTLRGVAAMAGKVRDLHRHRAAMTRSFALAATAVTFRAYHMAFFHLGLADETNYLASLWLSIVGNAAIAELALRVRRPRTAVIQASLPSIS